MVQDRSMLLVALVSISPESPPTTQHGPSRPWMPKCQCGPCSCLPAAPASSRARSQKPQHRLQNANLSPANQDMHCQLARNFSRHTVNAKIIGITRSELNLLRFRGLSTKILIISAHFNQTIHAFPYRLLLRPWR